MAETSSSQRAHEFSELRLQGVVRRYGTMLALKGVDLQVRRGEFVALLGPSGCGKSTALACLAGLQPLTAGSIWMDDRRIDTLPPERRGFGMVFQNYALFPHLSVQRNVEFGLAMRKVPRGERAKRAQEALETVQLMEHAHKFPGQLSGGQQQRVAIARAIAIRSNVVLMDEPLSNLDAKLRLEMRTEIKRLHQSLGLTTLYVTHDQEEALSLATRIVVLRAGGVEQIGTPEEIYNQPISSYVANFIGFRNLLEAKVEASTEAGGVAHVVGAGFRFAGTAPAAVKSGSALIAIRPEEFVVGGSGENDALVTVDVVEYHGRTLMVSAHFENGPEVHFRTDQPVAVGDTVRISVAPERALVYPA